MIITPNHAGRRRGGAVRTAFLACGLIGSGCLPLAAADKSSNAGQGIASFYGRGENGSRTASGERFDMHALTAAHRTAPLGSHLRVTNLRNGRSVVVRINDRGPFVRGRIIDLSQAAADRLGFVGAGLTRVALERVAADTATPATTAVADTAPAETRPEPTTTGSIPKHGRDAARAADETRVALDERDLLLIARSAPRAN